MELNDLYKLSGFIKENESLAKYDMEIVMQLDKTEHELLDLKLYQMTPQTNGKFTHANVVTAVINGVKFRFEAKKD